MATNLNTIEHHKKQLIEALKKSMGIVSSACDKVGISRGTFYNYVNSDENFKNEVEAIYERTIDFAESALFKSIQNGSDTATIFYLKTKGRNRGYQEKQEIKMDITSQELQEAARKHIESLK